MKKVLLSLAAAAVVLPAGGALAAGEFTNTDNNFKFDGAADKAVLKEVDKKIAADQAKKAQKAKVEAEAKELEKKLGNDNGSAGPVVGLDQSSQDVVIPGHYSSQNKGESLKQEAKKEMAKPEAKKGMAKPAMHKSLPRTSAVK